jgi:hypothetical protein
MMACVLNLYQGPWIGKPLLTASTVIASACTLLTIFAMSVIGNQLYNLTPLNFRTTKQFNKGQRQYYQGIIQPFDTTNTIARLLKWYDVFPKKTAMIFTVILLYTHPLYASTLLTLISLIDVYLASRDLTGIMFLNTLIFIEAFGFMLVFAYPALVAYEAFSPGREDLIGNLYLWFLTGVLGAALLRR